MVKNREGSRKKSRERSQEGKSREGKDVIELYKNLSYIIALLFVDFVLIVEKSISLFSFLVFDDNEAQSFFLQPLQSILQKYKIVKSICTTTDRNKIKKNIVYTYSLCPIIEIKKTYKPTINRFSKITNKFNFNVVHKKEFFFFGLIFVSDSLLPQDKSWSRENANVGTKLTYCAMLTKNGKL